MASKEFELVPSAQLLVEALVPGRILPPGERYDSEEKAHRYSRRFFFYFFTYVIYIYFYFTFAII